MLATEQLPFFREQHGVVGHLLGGWAVSTAYILSSGQPYTPIQFSLGVGSGAPYWDVPFNNGFVGNYDFGGARPFVSNPSAPATQVGIYAADSCNNFGVGCTLAPNQLISLNMINNPPAVIPPGDADGFPVTKSQVRFIANGLEADTLAGTPFGDAARNSLRDFKTNNVNLSIIKNFKFWERANVQLHLDMLNAFNHAQYSTIDPFVDDAGYQLQGTGFADPQLQSSTARSLRIGPKDSVPLVIGEREQIKKPENPSWVFGLFLCSLAFAQIKGKTPNIPPTRSQLVVFRSPATSSPNCASRSSNAPAGTATPNSAAIQSSVGRVWI